MRIIIFGVGEVYKKCKNDIGIEDSIVAFIDNKVQLQGEKINGIEIYSPMQIHKLSYDVIVIMSNSFIEMKNQLLQMDCNEEDIIPYMEYVSWQKKGEMQFFFADNPKKYKKNCLIITYSLGYHGSAITAVYTALELLERGYEIVIAAPDGDKQFINEFSKRGITFFIYPNLKFARWGEMTWIEKFQTIIVNTYPMILCALEISEHRKVAVWLHESDNTYPSMAFWKDKIIKNVSNPNLSIYAVSNVAKKNFIKNVAECKINVLPYGIPDSNKEKPQKKTKLVFAIIGTIFPIKQQLLYLSAIEFLDRAYQEDNVFLIIGENGEDTAYVEKVEKKIEDLRLKGVKLIGGLEKEQMEKKYKEIDVVVVASSQETMSLVATEAMMHEKVCIVCDAAGMAEFIEHRKNGLIYKTNDVKSLSEQMTYCIENRYELEKIGRNARSTYCKNFTMKMFGNRIEKEIIDV